MITPGTNSFGDFHLPLGTWVAAIVDWITTYLSGFFDAVRYVFTWMDAWMEYFLATPPFWVVVAVLVVLAFVAKGWKLALGAAVGLLFIVSVGQWTNAMDTLALVIVAAGLAVVFSIPLGIWAARSDAASRVIRPVLDFMQTTPAFVYLIPALLLFRVGVVPGIVATIVFAMAPGVRLTELGIRGVPSEVVEAGAAFGSSPWRILRQIQLPLAKASIMAGINQVIMLSLSMVVIAGMVGAGGLGEQIVASLNRIDVGLGAEAGLSVVVLAILLDRLTAALGGDSGRASRLFGRRKRATATPNAASATATPNAASASATPSAATAQTAATTEAVTDRPTVDA